MTTLPRACPLCMGRILFEKTPPGVVEAGSCKNCKALVVVVLPYSLLSYAMSYGALDPLFCSQL